MNQALYPKFGQKDDLSPAIDLLSTQQGIFLADHLSPIEDLYTIAHCLELPKSLNLAQFKKAIELGLKEADTVTARYSSDPAQANFRLDPNTDIRIEELNFCHLSPENAQQRLWDWMPTDRENAKSLKANARYLYRQALFVMHDKVYWYQRYHHIMLDGFSIINLTKRIVEIYQLLQQQLSITASPFISVHEAIQERKKYESSPDYLKDQNFWKNYCQDLPAPVSLSTHHLAAKTTAQFVKHQLRFSQAILQNLQKISSAYKTALPDIMMSLSLHYLHKMTDKAELVMGIPFMRRLGSKALRALLPTVNVLPVKFTISTDESWMSLAQHVQSQLKVVRPHQRYDAEQILRDLNGIDVHERIYSSILNYKAFDQDLEIDGQKVHTQHISTGPIDDFEFSFIIQDQELIIELRADALRYSQAELVMHGQRITLLLEQAMIQPESPCSTFNICTVQEIELLNAAGTGQKIPHPENYNNILDIFYQQAALNPNRTAIVSGERADLKTLNFLELKTRINQFTRFLKSQGASRNTVIAGAIPRSVESVVMMLSVLNSGASFLPLDLDYPIDRMQMMCEDANPLFILTTEAISAQLPANIQRIFLDQSDIQAKILAQDATDILASERQFNFQDVAYVIFTSGSTGRPKGVMNTHGSLVNLILSHKDTIYWPALNAVNQRFPERPLRAAHTHSFSFDSSWLQVFWMIWGQELHIFDENMRRDAWGLVQEIQKRHIDTLDLPPSFCAQMISNGLFESDQHHPSLILIGGEAAPLALWQQLNAQENLFAHNLYGPTEYTVDTFRAELKLTDRPVIGNPIANTQAYVLDKNLQRCAIGVIGELYISGFGIANGYLGRADLSTTRFIANPYQDGTRMYRTGDLVRWNMQGKLEFMGRCDDQIKIRGYRVEIGEVENALSILADIESAVVIAEPINNSHRLLGYCVVKDIQLNEEKSAQLSEYYLSQLRQNLPEYMVPSALTVMQQFPRNVSGKVDKKALPKPQVRTQSRSAQTPEQKLLCQLAASILKLDRMGIDDDFFMVGGDSISAIILCTQLRQHGFQLKPSDVFQYKTMVALSHQIVVIDPTSQPSERKELISDAVQGLVKSTYGQDYCALPLLPLQKGMLFHAQTDQQASYNAFTRLSLDGEIDPVQLQSALTHVLKKHPQLSGCFDQSLAEESLFVYSENPIQAWPVQLSQCEHEHLEQHIDQILQQNMQLDQPYGLIRAVLVQSSEKHSELLIIVHHLLTDGWSTPLFLNDLLEAYSNQEHSLTPLNHDYASVIEALLNQDQQEAQRIWSEDLKDAQAMLLFEQQHSVQVQEQSLSLSPELSAKLQHQLRQHGITLNVFMQMIWAMTLQSYAHKEDIIFGTPVSGRSAPIHGIEQQIGLFLNTIPVRVEINPELSVWEQLEQLQHLHIRHIENDGLGLGQIQQQVGQGNLFDSLLVVENYPDNQYLHQKLGQAKISKMSNRGYSHYPLALLVIPNQSIELLLEHRGVIAEPEQFLKRIEQLIVTALYSPNTRVQQYPVILSEEFEHIQQINQTEHPVPHSTLQQLLRLQAQRSLTDIALVDAEHELSFQQIRLQVCALAQQLQQLNVVAGDIVAVALPRSARLSLAILAVIEAGAAYLPIDLNLPKERIEYLLADAKPRMIICESDLLQRLEINSLETTVYHYDHLIDENKINLKQYHTTLITPQHPAYVIYTSGTTGQPKGVMVSHQAIVNRILWMQDQYPLDASDTILQKTPCSFDVSVWEFFWSYMVGAKLAMAPVHAHRDPMALLNCIDQYQVTTMHFVPSMLAVFDSMLEEVLNASQRHALALRRVFCSGEALPTSLAKSFSYHFKCELHNLYGPTEAAVDVSFANARYEQLQPNQLTESSISIGAPVWNTQLYVLDEYLRPLPVGVEGELYLAGDQLALGYINRADLTATRFVANPFVESERMYRTGDIARWTENGEVQYVGRADDQVKIRGQRIELGEIEQQLREVSGIDEVVVHAVKSSQDSSTLKLVAYLKCSSGSQTLSSTQLKNALIKVLPHYMVPEHYMYLAAFPLSHNGKLDRKLLPQPELLNNTSQRFAQTETESTLTEIFKQLLDMDREIAVDEDFFALGGHSILVMKLAIEIRKKFQRTLAMSQLMSNVSIQRLAGLILTPKRLDELSNSHMQAVLPIRNGTDRPVFCFYPGSGSAWQYTVLTQYLDPNLPIIGLQSPRVDGLLANSADMQELVEKQLAIILEQQAHGPYTFIGYSLGGTVAYAVAALLEQRGEKIDFLGLLDTYPAEIHQWAESAELDDDVEEEQLQFFDAILNDVDVGFDEQTIQLQKDIDANYRDAVRLLKPFNMPKYHGHMDLFVARQGLLEYIHPQEQWQPLVGSLTIHDLEEASHTTLMSPEQLIHLGPQLNQLIGQARSVQEKMS